MRELDNVVSNIFLSGSTTGQSVPRRKDLAGRGRAAHKCPAARVLPCSRVVETSTRPIGTRLTESTRVGTNMDIHDESVCTARIDRAASACMRRHQAWLRPVPRENTDLGSSRRPRGVLVLNMPPAFSTLHPASARRCKRSALGTSSMPSSHRKSLTASPVTPGQRLRSTSMKLNAAKDVCIFKCL